MSVLSHKTVMNMHAMTYLARELQESPAQPPGVELDVNQMNSCQGVCGGRTGTNYKSNLTTEAQTPAQGST